MAMASSGYIVLQGPSTGTPERSIGGQLGNTAQDLVSAATRTLTGKSSGAITMPDDFWGKPVATATLYEFVTAGSFGPFAVSASSIQYLVVGAGGRGGGYRIQTFTGEYTYGGGGGGGAVISGTATGTPGNSYTVVVGNTTVGSIFANAIAAGSSSLSGSWGSTLSAGGGLNGGRGESNLGNNVGGDGGNSGNGNTGGIGGAGMQFGGGGGGSAGSGGDGDSSGTPGAGSSVTLPGKTYSLAMGGWGDGAVAQSTDPGSGGNGAYATNGTTNNGQLGQVGIVAVYF
jgi:hypothetical protein